MYIDKYGLTNSKVEEVGAENSILWTLQHLLLERKLSKNASSEARLADLKRAIENCRVGDGLYMQNPSHVTIPPKTGKEAYMSHDQLITIMMVSKYHGLEAHKEIFKKILKQGVIRYNNVEDKKLRLIHPRDWVLYASLNCPVLGNFLLSLLCVASIIACFSKREVTSGKLLAWTKNEVLKEHFLIMKVCSLVCDLIIKLKHGSWTDVFEIYHNKPHHPIAKLAREVYGE